MFGAIAWRGGIAALMGWFRISITHETISQSTLNFG
jgi:hypothetical protein